VISESTQNKVSGYAYVLALIFAVAYAFSVQSVRWAALCLCGVALAAAPKHRAAIRHAIAHPVITAKTAPAYALMCALMALSFIPGWHNLLWVAFAILIGTMLAPRLQEFRKPKCNPTEI
jgi:hypothetical protein